MVGGDLGERPEVGTRDWFPVRDVEGPWGPVVDHHLERLRVEVGEGGCGSSRVGGDDDDDEVGCGS